MFAPRVGVQNSYSSSVLIGNWSEDQSLHALRIQDFLTRKQNHQLLIQHVDTQHADCLQEVGLSFCPDGRLHYGDHVLLYSLSTQGVLSCDPSDASNAGERGFAVTTSGLTKAHVARNTFVLEPYSSRETGVRAVRSGDLLCYGDLFRLRVNPKLCGGEARYLHSQPVGGSSSSRVSRQQEVCMSANGGTFDTVWKIAAQQPSKRFQSNTQPVPSSAPVLLLHAATNQALSSSALRHLNDFGSEFEVCCHTQAHVGRVHGLHAERLGLKVGEEGGRGEAVDNHWAVLTAGTRERELLLARDEEQVLAAITALLDSVRQHILALGPAAVHSLSSSLWLADGRRNDCLRYADFLAAVQSSVPSLPALPAAEAELLCNHYDEANDGHVDYARFLRTLRGEFPAARREAALEVYASMDSKGEDCISVERMRAAWTGKGELDSVWSVYEQRAGGVSSERWLDFYMTESAFIHSDEFFLHALHASWRRDLR
jgi:hypothetical protein